ncbi:helix-turn-helix domain-containing protein [Clostridium haemolyticum]|uniref:helix-turn-helix domain-containing protein n=1 Tax=Clostridium haemolyticum TaxID=84025 RepID=UPI000FFBA595|nr:helix-turn-helix domain-containing protein [Clostridium haemolyticum]
MKSRKTTHEERVEIVKWVINNNMNYKEAANLNGIKYALVYQWVQKYISNGPDALRLKKRGPHKKHSIAEESLNKIEKLKLELERERHLRKRAELRLEIHKKEEVLKRSFAFENKVGVKLFNRRLL